MRIRKFNESQDIDADALKDVINSAIKCGKDMKKNMDKISGVIAKTQDDTLTDRPDIKEALSELQDILDKVTDISEEL